MKKIFFALLFGLFAINMLGDGGQAHPTSVTGGTAYSVICAGNSSFDTSKKACVCPAGYSLKKKSSSYETPYDDDQPGTVVDTWECVQNKNSK